MCIINKPINLVASTSIFGGLNKTRDRQIIIYKNTIDTDTPNNAMILPVPHAHSTIFHSMESYEHFFEDLKDNFQLVQKTRSMLKSYNVLPVVDVGSYRVSVVPTLQAFQNLDPSEFLIDSSIQNIFSETYPEWFGYIVCKLKTGIQRYEPLAYSFDVYGPEKLFFPTLHVHPHVHATLGRENVVDDWDHDIYILNFTLKKGSTKMITTHFEFRYKHVKEMMYNRIDFDMDDETYVEKIRISGRHINTDMFANLDTGLLEQNNDDRIHVFIGEDVPGQYFVKLHNESAPPISYSWSLIQAYFVDRISEFRVQCSPTHPTLISADPLSSFKLTSTILSEHCRREHNYRIVESNRLQDKLEGHNSEATEYTCCADFHLAMSCENIVTGSMKCLSCHKTTKKVRLLYCTSCSKFEEDSHFVQKASVITCKVSNLDIPLHMARHKTAYL